MKLYAQHGHAPSDKLTRGLSANVIDGVIFSPRYVKYERLRDMIRDLRSASPSATLLLDPEYYATFHADAPNAQLGYLEEWDHFVPYKRTTFVTDSGRLDEIIELTLQVQQNLGLRDVISPSLFISSSFDSIEAAVAINFLQRTRIVSENRGIKGKVFSTLAVHRDALLDRRNFLDFVNSITAMDGKPDGVYLLVAGGSISERSGSSRSDVLQAEIIGAWMFLNLALSLNGMEVVNAYSDILTPFLGVAGGTAGATGWWSNLQVLSMGKYIRTTGGGRLPIIRYLSKRLLNRVPLADQEAYASVFPEINNGLPHDAVFSGREPSRTEEVLQNWEAIASLNDDFVLDDVNESLDKIEVAVTQAEAAGDALSSYGFSELNREHITSLAEGIRWFKELAEL